MTLRWLAGRCVAASALLFALLARTEATQAQTAQSFAQLPPGVATRVDATRLKKARKTGRVTIPLRAGEKPVRALVLEERRSAGIDTIRAKEGTTYAVLATNGRDAFGMIERDGRHYVVHTVNGEVLVADEARLPVERFDPEIEALADAIPDPENTARRARLAAKPGVDAAAADANGSTEVDMALFYEPAMEDLLGGPATVRTYVHANVAFLNEALRRSAVPVTVRAVFVGRYPKEFPVGPDATLSDSDVRAIAQRFGADLRYTFYIAKADRISRSHGYRLGPASLGNVNNGMGVFAHNVGHNFGADHSRNDPGVPQPPGSYNHGFMCGGAPTIMYQATSSMTLPNGWRWHYSTPDIVFEGEPCGIRFDQPNAAHNARTIDVNRATVAAFAAPQLIHGSVAFAGPAEIAVSERDRHPEVRVWRDGDLGKEASVEVYSIPDTATEGLDYRPVVERVVFAPGEVEKRVVLDISDDEAIEGRESFRLVLASPNFLAVTPGDVTVSIEADDDVDLLNPVEELQAFAKDGILRWGQVPGADAYEVWAYSDPAMTQLAEFSKALASRQYQFTRLQPGQDYYVRLFFRVGGVWHERSPFSIRTAEAVQRPRLILSQDEVEAFVDGGTLRWSPVAGAESYEVWVYQDKGLTALVRNSGPVRETQYALDNLADGVTYYVQVYAKINGAFFVGAPLPVTASAQATKARILNPQDELDDFAPDGILRWNAVTGATSYEVWIFTNPNASEIFESSGGLAGRSYQARTLAPGTQYFAQVYALVEGRWVAGSPVRIRTAIRVTKPRLTNPQVELESLGTAAALKWTEVPDADAYEIWVFNNAGLGVVVESSATGLGREYRPTKLCAGGSYYVQVYARTGGQWQVGWPTRVSLADGAGPAGCLPPAPVVSVKANPSVLTDFYLDGRIGVSEISYSSKFAQTCAMTVTVSGTNSGAGGPYPVASGRLSLRLEREHGAGNWLYSVTCTGPGGTTVAQTLVTVRRRNFCELYGCTLTDFFRIYGDKG